MGLLNTLFRKRQPCPEYERLVEELIRIGLNVENPNNSSSGYYLRNGRTSEERRHPRARQIGEQLNRMGGWELMSEANRRVAEVLGGFAANELSCVWHEIGDWLW